MFTTNLWFPWDVIYYGIAVFSHFIGLKYIGLQYNALSFIFLQVRELSWLQWHPFSVSSSPLDGKHHLAILIKVLGGWTERLRDSILSMSEPELSKTTITASVEGPYGHETPYHLMYVLPYLSMFHFRMSGLNF